MVGGNPKNKNKKKKLTYTHPTLEIQSHKSYIAKDPMCNKTRKIILEENFYVSGRAGHSLVEPVLWTYWTSRLGLAWFEGGLGPFALQVHLHKVIITTFLVE